MTTVIAKPASPKKTPKSPKKATVKKASRKSRADKGKKHNYPKNRKKRQALPDGQERAPRSDKGSKHNYPKNRKKRASSGKKRKETASSKAIMVAPAVHKGSPKRKKQKTVQKALKVSSAPSGGAATVVASGRKQRSDKGKKHAYPKHRKKKETVAQAKAVRR
jgi:hypothetical protein